MIHDRFSKDEDPQAGLTLVEVLVALVIVSIGLLGIAGLQARAIGCNRIARMQTEATALAAAMLERMRLLPFDHPDLTPGPALHRRRPEPNSACEAHWAVIADHPTDGTKTVRIRVRWSGAPYGSNVRMQTIIYRKAQQ